jgi:6,7-dimethyl-8-ribityllumazine synthase
MASELKNLSDYSNKNLSTELHTVKIGILVSEWNKEVTESLANGAYETLIKEGIHTNNIIKDYVPGSYELPLAAQIMIEKAEVDAVICLGCVIQGETRHFEFICQAVAKGIMDVNLRKNTPVIFGVLTTDNQEQALARSGGNLGNKGVEAAAAALKMIALKK